MNRVKYHRGNLEGILIQRYFLNENNIFKIFSEYVYIYIYINVVIVLTIEQDTDKNVYKSRSGWRNKQRYWIFYSFYSMLSISRIPCGKLIEQTTNI